MSYDLFVKYPCVSTPQLDAISGDDNLNVRTKIHLLGPAVGTEATRDTARRKYKQLLETPVWTERQRTIVASAGLAEPKPPDLASLNLPPCSVWLQIKFTLARPYFSRDDEAFHIIDNPLRKEKIFGVPMVAASGWKGNLRWAAMKVHLEPERDNAVEFVKRRIQHTHLFGSEKGTETPREHTDWMSYLDHRCTSSLNHQETCADPLCSLVGEKYRKDLRNYFHLDLNDAFPHLAGRLHFYPTFFDRIGLEVINPHDRARRVGKIPILYEVAPVDSLGVLTLLYVPFDMIHKDDAYIRSAAKIDLELLGKALPAMLYEYGFSAKKSISFGLVKKNVVAFNFVAHENKKPIKIKEVGDLIRLGLLFD